MNMEHRRTLLASLEILNGMEDRKMIKEFLDDFTPSEVRFMQERRINNQMLVTEMGRYHFRWFRRRFNASYRMNQWLGWLARELL